MILHAACLGAAKAAALLSLLSGAASDLSENVFRDMPAPDLIGTAYQEDPDLWSSVGSAFSSYYAKASPSWVSDLPRDSGGPEVWLLAVYDDGSVSTGTGTVVLGDDHQARVLTAGHVSPWDLLIEDEEGGMSQVSLVETFAFSPSGEVLARLETSFISYRDAEHEAETAAELSEDLAVLSVTHLSPDVTAEEWVARGVRIAADQPEWVMMVMPDINGTTMNPGISGASVRNLRNEVVGVISYSFSDFDRISYAEDADFLSRVRSGVSASDHFRVSASVRDYAEA